MKKRNFQAFLFILFGSVFLSSCDVTDDPRLPPNGNESNNTYALCDKIWVDYYNDNTGMTVEHELTFNLNGRGVDKRIFRYPQGTRVDSYPFQWRWSDYTEEGLVWEYVTPPPYPDNEKVIYFDDVSVRNHYLSGELFNNHVTFVDSRIL